MAGKTKNVKTQNKKIKRSVSAALMMVLLPITAVAIAAIIIFLSIQAENTIVKIAKADLQDETDANGGKLERQVAEMVGSVETYATTLESVDFGNISSIQKYLATSVDTYDLAPDGVYVGFEDDSYAFADGHTPSEGWVATERGWYQDGLKSDTIEDGEPYIDDGTGGLCVTFARKINGANGLTGVVATDAYLADIVTDVASLTPLTTGRSALTTSDMVLSYFNESLNGTSIADSGDSYLQSLLAYAQSGSTDVTELTYEGEAKYVAFTPIEGTDWYLYSSVSKADVLADFYAFRNICYIIMVATIIILGGIIMFAINQIISKPVKKLADDIVEISHGNFTVELPKGKGDEIGLIQDEMREYVATMRRTISDIQSTSNELEKEANASKNASSKLTSEAKEQSVSMDQIRETMDGMSQAVSELANNATELANAVGDLSDKGKTTNQIMSDLVKKADDGQRDMNLVVENMHHISESMSDMNNVVTEVDSSAQKITSIIEMINSISEQTNLLSLNASIEAARAGEAGKGFAVVASEIAKLATDSGEATKEIEKIINDITSQIESLSAKSQANMNAIEESSESVSVAGQTFADIFNDLTDSGRTMEEMIDMMSNVDGIATSVAAISQEQSASSEEVTATTENLAVSAQSVSEESEGVDRSADTVSKSAASIGKALSVFNI